MTLRCKLFGHTTAGETTAEKIDGVWWHCCSRCEKPIDKHPLPGQDVELRE